MISSPIRDYLLTHKLPTASQIAVDLDIPMSTVYAALRQLGARREKIGRNRFGYTLRIQDSNSEITRAEADQIIGELREIGDQVRELIREIEKRHYPNRNMFIE